MSSIQSLNASQSYQTILQSRFNGIGSAAETDFQTQANAKLSSELSAQGLTQEDQDSLKAELQGVLDEVLQSGQAPPDQESLESSLKEFFEKYGVDTSHLEKPAGPPGGGRPGGPPPSGYEDSTSETDSTQTLLDMLSKAISEQSGNANSQTSSIDLLNAVIGLDAEA